MGNRLTLCFLWLSTLAACGANSNPPLTYAVAPVIRVQPANLSVAPGHPATFEVDVVPAAEVPSVLTWKGLLRYQWRLNGSVLRGATAPTWTTRPAEVVDGGTYYTVTIWNDSGEVVSAPAALRVEPAPWTPPPSDLRFKGVDAVVARLPETSGHDEIYAGTSSLLAWVEGQGVAGAPLLMRDPTCIQSTSGGVACSWNCGFYDLPDYAPNHVTLFTPGFLSMLEDDLRHHAVPNGIVASMDIDDGGGFYAISRHRIEDRGTYSESRLQIPVSELAEAANLEGRSGRVVTAVAPHSGSVFALSYSWSGGTGSPFEATALAATEAEVPAAAASLSSSGYVITAFGRDGSGGYLLVGTRVPGDTTPRPIQLFASGQRSAILERGYAAVGSYLATGPEDGPYGTQIWIAQQ